MKIHKLNKEVFDMMMRDFVICHLFGNWYLLRWYGKQDSKHRIGKHLPFVGKIELYDNEI